MIKFSFERYLFRPSEVKKEMSFLISLSKAKLKC